MVDDMARQGDAARGASDGQAVRPAPASSGAPGGEINVPAGDPGGLGDPDLGILLALGFRAYVDRLHALIAEEGFPRMRPTFGYTFRALRDGPLAPHRLASQLAISKQAVGKILDEMEAEGFVARTPDPCDGRQKLVSLTDRGHAARQAALRISASVETELRAQLGSDAVDAARTTLLTLAAGSPEEVRARRARPVW